MDYRREDRIAMERANEARKPFVIRSIYGRKAKFCDEGCAESFKEDRKRGLVYGSMEMGDGTVLGWEAASIASGHCAYCGVGTPLL